MKEHKNTKHDIAAIATDGETYRFSTQKVNVAIVIDEGDMNDNLFSILDGKYDDVIDAIIKHKKENNMEEHDKIYKYEDIEDVFVVNAEFRNHMIHLEIRIEMKDGSLYEVYEQVPSVDFMIESVNDGTARLLGHIKV